MGGLWRGRHYWRSHKGAGTEDRIHNVSIESPFCDSEYLRFSFGRGMWSPAFAQAHPDFSGDWMLDKSQTVGAAPWGQTHAEEMVITQAADGLTLAIKTDSYNFSLDGAPHSTFDRRMGGQPNFVRKTEIVATWSGRNLIIKVTELSEQTDTQLGRYPSIPASQTFTR